jgi:hypothetical protein
MSGTDPGRDAPDLTGPDFTGPDFTGFDELVGGLERWTGSFPEWPPARQVRAEWEQVAGRLDRARRELARMLVVGVVGGTGTGKSTLVNALAGRDVTAAGDVARPTTVTPVVVAPADVDLSWLPLAPPLVRLVRTDAPALANIVLVDCPDPDTQGPAAGRRDAGRPSDTNHNRDLLEQVLPACDVLLLVATAQKYRSWIVAREVAAFAPGRPLLFVQTHASRDADIRDDWRRELESQGFSVPRIFRLDAVDAAARQAAAVEPEPGFRDLVAAIDAELVGRASRRVRRTGSLDLAGWFLRQARGVLEPVREPVGRLSGGVRQETARLEGVLAVAVADRLRSGRPAWQKPLTDELVAGWHGGPFAMFLHAVAAVGGLWPRRSAGGGIVGRLLAGEPAATAGAAGAWAAAEELGLEPAEVEQSRSVLAGLAARARIGEPLVGRARLDDAQAAAGLGTVLARAGGWLSSGLDRLVAARRGRLDGPLFRGCFELLFSGLLAAVLLRAGWNFFVGHLWQGRPLDGGGFLQEALIWIVLWGFALRAIALAAARFGIDRDVAALVARVPEARLVEPVLADFAGAAGAAERFLAEADRLTGDHAALAAALAEPAGDLGRLRGAGP